jgi:DNA-binding response OmpR family regulator
MKSPVIFIVDKNPIRGSLLGYRLKGRNFSHIQVFPDEKECLYRIMKNASPEILIADTGPDAVTGIEFIRRVLEHSPDTRIIYYTDIDDEVLAGALLRAGASDYICRPTDSDNGLRELIENVRFLMRAEIPVR